jgi:hypothetical protein
MRLILATLLLLTALPLRAEEALPQTPIAAAVQKTSLYSEHRWGHFSKDRADKIPTGSGHTFAPTKSILKSHEMYAVGLDTGLDTVLRDTKLNFKPVNRDARIEAPKFSYANVVGFREPLVSLLAASTKSEEVGFENRRITRYTPWVVVNTLVDSEKTLKANVDKAKTQFEDDPNHSFIREEKLTPLMSYPEQWGVKRYFDTNDYDKALKGQTELEGMGAMFRVADDLMDNALTNTWEEALLQKFGDNRKATREWLSKNISKTAADNPEKNGMAESATKFVMTGRLPGFLNDWGAQMLLPQGRKPSEPAPEAGAAPPPADIDIEEMKRRLKRSAPN